jgi:hypothetical protein
MAYVQVVSAYGRIVDVSRTVVSEFIVIRVLERVSGIHIHIRTDNGEWGGVRSSLKQIA